MKISFLPPEYAGDPEAVAMLQAYYSRSKEPINDRLNRLGNDLSSVKKALEKTYIGYGHNSIADCGSVTIFIEDVSIVAAKAIQENSLYNGQECSTRYLNIGEEGYVSTDVTKWWFNTYKIVNDLVLTGIRKEHPFQAPDGFDINDPKHTKPGSDYFKWLNATKARAFDIARGWIPATALTSLSWHTTLRKLREFTTILMAHPLEEVRLIAHAIKEEAKQKYPFAIPSELKDYELDQIKWLEEGGENAVYHSYNKAVLSRDPLEEGNHVIIRKGFIPLEIVDTGSKQWIDNRPKFAEFPQGLFTEHCILMVGEIDYGTWRDMQRHRVLDGLPPKLLKSKFHPWYLEQLVRYADPSSAHQLVFDTKAMFSANTSKELTEYELPLGNVVVYYYRTNIAGAVYFAELRSGITVHPILRPIAQQLGKELNDVGIKTYVDMSESDFDIKRGSQTIVENPN